MTLTLPPAGNETLPAGADHRRRVERVIRLLRQPADEPPTLATMAACAGFSPFHFSRVFRDQTGVPPGVFHGALRLERAKQLLVETDLPVTDVCFEAGYTSLGSFVARFSRLVGVSPGRLRALAGDDRLARIGDARVADAARFDADHVVTGRIDGPVDGSAEGRTVFVGLFPNPIAQGRPAAGTIRRGPGPFRIAGVAPGRYHLLAAALPASAAPAALLLPSAALVAASGPIEVRAASPIAATVLALRPPRTTDSPIVVALPALLDGVGDASRPGERKIGEAGARDRRLPSATRANERMFAHEATPGAAP